MRTIILGLCLLIITLTTQNFYMQQEIAAALKAEKYNKQIIEKFSAQIRNFYQENAEQQ